MEGRNQVFHKLKPPCLALSQAALKLNGSRPDSSDVTRKLDTLKRTLDAITNEEHALDPKLAEYAFFPISQVLKASKKVSVHGLEFCMQCISILIESGWRQQLQTQLAAQLVIFCTLLGEKEPRGLGFAEATDELRTSAFRCLYYIFIAADSNDELTTFLTSDPNFPQLGQTISVMLDCVHDSGSTEAQVAAVQALEALVIHVIDREIQASFLPGIVSKLTRVLIPQTKLRRRPTVLIRCLSLLEHLLSNTMGETSLIGRDKSSTRKNGGESMITAEWQQAAAKQIKPAFMGITRLRAHGREDVRQAVGRLCFMLLEGCHKSLATCSEHALETLIWICTANVDHSTSLRLESAVRNSSQLTQLLQNLLYDWLRSLSLALHGSDEQAKVARLDQITFAYSMLVKVGANTPSFDQMLCRTLSESFVVLLSGRTSQDRSSALVSPAQTLHPSMLVDTREQTVFALPLLQHRSQEGTMLAIDRLTKLVNSSSPSFSTSLARALRQSSGDSRLATFWLLLRACGDCSETEHQVAGLLNLADGESAVREHCIEDLYSYSLSLLSDSSEDTIDPRLQVLALRGLALRAQSAGKDFRYELVDALYPVLHTLATPLDELQHDSMITLNILTSACGYDSVTDLIVRNVDYLTNAVALKLNAFDVSPQAPQVLLMMIRLAGPKLLPYLEDTLQSIFAALEDYHGYTLLVELLFKVLAVMAEEGTKVPQLAVTKDGTRQINRLKLESWTPTSLVELANILSERAEDEKTLRGTKHGERQNLEAHPQRPWKADTEPDQSADTDPEVGSDSDQQLQDQESLPPVPKTYGLLFKITEMTQHFLPSSSTSLRQSLLSLIRTTLPAMSRHEDSFLPLVNTLWPEIVSRLDDAEKHVVVGALEVVGALCDHAGDFMRSRIVQLWPRLVEIYRSTNDTIELPPNVSRRKPTLYYKDQSAQASANTVTNNRLQQSHALADLAQTSYNDTSYTLLKTALINTLTSVIASVEILPDIFDEALEMLRPAFGQEEVRDAVEQNNADAMWLMKLKCDMITTFPIPKVPEKASWAFAPLQGWQDTSQERL